MTVSFPMATAAGFVIAMGLAVALTGTAGIGRSDRSRTRAAGGPLTLFGAATVYLVVLLPIFSGPGITLSTLFALVVAVVLPVLVAGWVRAPMGAWDDQRTAFRDAVAGVVALALLAGQLAVAGAIMSLFGGVNRILATAAFGIATAAYLLGSGRIGSIRTSRYAVAGVVVAVLILVIGLVLGSPGTIITPLVSATPMSIGTVAAVLLVVAALAAFDPNLRSALTEPLRPGRALVGGVVLIVVTVFALGIGGILFLGGVLQAPNLEIMTVFAVVPPFGIMVMMLVVTFLLASNADALLSAGAQSLAGAADPAVPRAATTGLAGVAIVIAVLIPNPTLYIVLAAVVAAVSIGALVPSSLPGKPDSAAPGKPDSAAGNAGDRWIRVRDPRNPWPAFVVGSIAAIIVGVVLGSDEVVAMTGRTAVVVTVAAVVAGLAALTMRGRGSLTSTGRAVAAESARSLRES